MFLWSTKEKMSTTFSIFVGTSFIWFIFECFFKINFFHCPFSLAYLKISTVFLFRLSLAKVKRSKSFSSSESLSFKNGRKLLRVFSFLKPVKTECHNCPYKNSLGNVCELSCFETNEIFCLSDVILITNLLANSNKVFVA